MASKNQIGELLVKAGIISVKTLERALEMQKGSGKRLGTLLKEMGIVTEEEVIEALARQCNLQTVRGFAEHPFPKELLDLVPAQLAVEKLIFPLKHLDGVLTIATLDPFDRDTFDRLEKETGIQVHLALATRDDIFMAIRKHYLKGSPVKGSRQKVLLLDPSPVVTSFLRGNLENEGYEVIAAYDGIDGLKLAFSRHPDIVVCDQMMPRMDGYHFMNALKAHPEMTDIPVILMSAKNSTEEEHRALKAGFVDFVGKPAMPIRVLAKIQKAFAVAKSARHGTAARAHTAWGTEQVSEAHLTP